MRIDVNDSEKHVILWKASYEEKLQVPESIQAVLKEYRKRKYLIAHMVSGKEDLFENTLTLLKFNKKRLIAEDMEQ